MPTYEYRCPEGHVFEKFQKMSDKPRASCPTCGKAATRKISGGAGLVFKGSGFYITDYRDKSYTEKAKAESGGGDKSAAKTETNNSTSSDTASKPAATESKLSKKSDSKKK